MAESIDEHGAGGGIDDGAAPWPALTGQSPLIEPGHAAGDVLEAYKWRVVAAETGRLEIEAHLPEALKNPAGQLFGGFTTTYVDLASIFTLRTLGAGFDPTDPRTWITTINMRCDYFEPILGPTFRIVGEVENQRGKNFLVSCKFMAGHGNGGSATMAAHALTTLRQLDLS